MACGLPLAFEITAPQFNARNSKTVKKQARILDEMFQFRKPLSNFGFCISPF
jgi:hypothetical protein